jgi:hypothetical protein
LKGGKEMGRAFNFRDWYSEKIKEIKEVATDHGDGLPKSQCFFEELGEVIFPQVIPQGSNKRPVRMLRPDREHQGEGDEEVES